MLPCAGSETGKTKIALFQATETAISPSRNRGTGVERLWTLIAAARRIVRRFSIMHSAAVLFSSALQSAHQRHQGSKSNALRPAFSIGRKTVISKSKLGALVLAAMMGIAAPAFAQNLETGTAADTYGWNSPRADATSGGSSGLHAFGMAPRAYHRSGVRTFARVPRAHARLQ